MGTANNSVLQPFIRFA